jgi:hypothetical protein
MYQEDLQIEKLKQMKGEDKPQRKPAKKKDYQLFDKPKPKSKKVKTVKKIKKKQY